MNDELSKPAKPQYISTIQAAEALGVGVTTVKRWVDEGIIPAHKTAGGHRKLLLEDVLRLVRESKLPNVDLCKLIPQATAREHTLEYALLQLEKNALTIDAEAVRGIIIGLYEAGHPLEDIADQVVGPALTTIGNAWSTGTIDVLHEHRATQAIVAALYELRTRLKPPLGNTRPVAIGGAPEGDPTIVPTLLAKLVLCACDWNAINLGPHTPVKAFTDAIRELQPKLIWLCVTHIADHERFVRDYSELCRHATRLGIPVAIGGRELTSAIRMKIPYTTFGDGMTHLATFARSLHQPATAPRRGRPPKQGKEPE